MQAGARRSVDAGSAVRWGCATHAGLQRPSLAAAPPAQHIRRAPLRDSGGRLEAARAVASPEVELDQRGADFCGDGARGCRHT
jgi:hypothetical protein